MMPRAGGPAVSPLHLLHIAPTLGVGGREARLAVLVDALGDHFHHTFLALDGDVSFTTRIDSRHRIASVSLPARRARPLSYRIHHAIQSTTPDVLLTYNWGAMDAVIASHVNQRVPLIHTEDGFGPDEAVRPLRRRALARRILLRRAKAIVVISRTLAHIATTDYGVPSSRLRYIPNGIDTPRYAPGPSTWRQRHNIPEHVTLLGAVGRLSPEKRLDLMLRTVALLGRRDVHLAVIGQGAELLHLAALRDQLGLTARVHFVGHDNHPEDAYRAMTLFLMTSDTEQTPLALLEAMATGLPVVVTDVGDCRFMVPPDTHHLQLAPSNAPPDISATVRRLLDDDGARPCLAFRKPTALLVAKWVRMARSIPAVCRPAADSAARAMCLVVGTPYMPGTIDCDEIQEWLLRRLIEAGPSALAEVDNAFCGCYLDERTGDVLIFTDRFGLRRCFSAATSTGYLASSRALLLAGAAWNGVDPVGVASCLPLGHTMARRTIFEGTSSLMPATYLDLRSGVESTYVDIRHDLEERPLTTSQLNRIGDGFLCACRDLLNAQRSPAVNLTGGLDTRLILAAALSAGIKPATVTAGTTEVTVVTTVARAAGVTNWSIEAASAEPGDNEYLALFTDGKSSEVPGDRLLPYWRAISSIAPSGCLHGGLGEVWRTYYYKGFSPQLATLRRAPVDYLYKRLLRERGALVPLLHPRHRTAILDALRDDVRTVWNMVHVPDQPYASLDAFYLMQRQRGLTRVTSASELLNPAYSPFALAAFTSTALRYLGPQNRDDRLHRSLIARFAPGLSGLPLHGNGTSALRSRPASAVRAAVSTARYFGSSLLGSSWRARRSASSAVSRHTTYDRSLLGDVLDLQAAVALPSRHLLAPLNTITSVVAATPTTPQGRA